MNSRRCFLFETLASGLGGAMLPSAAAAQRPAARERSSASFAKLINEKAKLAIERGFKFLAQQQNDAGAFRGSGYNPNVAVVSLAGLAYMAGGHTPGRGKYGRQVSKCLGYVLDSVQPSGFITAQRSASHGPMYGHGFATLFLAEAYGMTRRRDLRDKLASAVKVIVNSQNKEGGWRYQPQRGEADISATICQVMGLRAARNAGVYVPNATIDKCIDYVKQCQNPDGGFMYMLNQPGNSMFPRSAAGVVALYSAGVYEGEEIEKGLSFLKRFPPAAPRQRRQNHYFYGQYYAVQAFWQAGGEDFEQWYTAIRNVLVESQTENGSWIDDIAPPYGTAMACIILQMPNNHLPIFIR